MKSVTYLVLIVLIICLIIGLFFFSIKKENDNLEIKATNKAEAENFKPGGFSILSWDLNHLYLPTKGSIEESLGDVSNFLLKQEADFYFFQNIDRNTKRSEKIDHVKELSGIFSNYLSYFGTGTFVLPFLNRKSEGLLSVSRFKPNWTKKIFYKGENTFSQNSNLYMMITEIESALSGKNWYLINIDFSAIPIEKYDKVIETLNHTAENYFDTENYVVIGGNWGRIFPGLTEEDFNNKYNSIKYIQPKLLGDNWQWCYDKRFASYKIQRQTLLLQMDF